MWAVCCNAGGTVEHELAMQVGGVMPLRRCHAKWMWITPAGTNKDQVHATSSARTVALDSSGPYPEPATGQGGDT